MCAAWHGGTGTGHARPWGFFVQQWPAEPSTGTYPYPYAGGVGRSTTMPDANIRIPEEAKERLAAIAAGEKMSLRAYLAHLADTLLTPQERAEQAEQARAALKVWNGYAPSAAEQRDLDMELDRRLAQAGGQ